VLAAALLSLLLISRCAHEPPPGMTPEAVVLAEQFYEDSSTVRQMRRFRDYSTEQYDLFIYGNQYRHPPAQYLAQCFALNGTAGVELLRTKLPSAANDLTVRDIARLLTEIDSMQTYDVAGDRELMAALRGRAETMKDPEWRALVAGWMVRIGQERRQPPWRVPACTAAMD
jgi:hypothetical protein